ncbi:MAG: hypothetical protein KDI25_12505, partial [Pseudomonadales bacterium]|nr:hypothetical protein [Pseudomonadales bacterium]
MAAGGRIVNYLKAMLEDPRHNVLFVGYQVPGTPGHEIMKAAERGNPNPNSNPNSNPNPDLNPNSVGASPAGDQNAEVNSGSHRLQGRLLRGRLHHHGLPSVDLDGERFDIRAGVDYVGGYSAHADQQNLLSFVRGMRRWPGEVRVVHGNEEARKALKRALKALAKEYGRTMHI